MAAIQYIAFGVPKYQITKFMSFFIRKKERSIFIFNHFYPYVYYVVFVPNPNIDLIFIGGFTQALQKMMMVVRPKSSSKVFIFHFILFIFLQLNFMFFFQINACSILFFLI